MTLNTQKVNNLIVALLPEGADDVAPSILQPGMGTLS